MALTVQEVYDSYSLFKADITDVGDSEFIQWCDWLNKFAYRYILGIDPERFIEEATILATAGVETADLPADFRDIQRFGCGLYVYTDSERNENQLTITNPNSPLRGYYIKNDKVYFTPAPVNPETYMLRYVPIEPNITLLTDEFISPLDARYMQYIIGAIDVLYSQWDEDLSGEGIADARFVRLLDELGANVRQEPGVYALDDTSLNF